MLLAKRLSKIRGEAKIIYPNFVKNFESRQGARNEA